jgi:Flp pilus assembly protein TadG
MHKRYHLRLKNQNGTAAVEFALVLPVFLMVVFSTLEFGMALYNKNVLTNASREGARSGIVARDATITDSMVDAQITQVVQNYTRGTLINLGKSTPTPTITIDRLTSPSFSNKLISVSVSYTFNGLGLGALLSALGHSLTLKSTTVMVKE